MAKSIEEIITSAKKYFFGMSGNVEVVALSGPHGKVAIWADGEVEHLNRFNPSAQYLEPTQTYLPYLDEAKKTAMKYLKG